MKLTQLFFAGLIVGLHSLPNRVCRIQKNVELNKWCHVRSENTSADLSSRRITPSELPYSKIWWPN